MEGGVVLHLEVPSSFSLSRSVCSYGFFMMQPNQWRDEEKLLERPLRLQNGRSVIITVWQETHKQQLGILARGLSELTEIDSQLILAQVKRMLRLSDEENSAVAAFQEIHPKARDEGFGRMFRSPTLFEDMVKSILLCNCSFPRTLQMARSLCELQFELKGGPIGHLQSSQRMKPENSFSPTPKKRKTVASRSVSRSTVRNLQNKFVEKMENASASVAEEEEEEEEAQEENDPHSSLQQAGVGAFPTPEELANLDPTFLSKRCGLGYRTKTILKLSQDVHSGHLQLEKLEGPNALQGEALRDSILQIYGFGPFCGANMMMLLGNYDVVPADTETVRHLKQFHGKLDVTKQNVRKVVATLYEKYKPFEFLAYWWEIWKTYEEYFGDLSSMDASNFSQITAYNIKKLKPSSS